MFIYLFLHVYGLILERPQSHGRKGGCVKNSALPLVAAVAAETPLRKWRIGHTLIQFTINKTLLDAGSEEHAALPYVALFRYATAPVLSVTGL